MRARAELAREGPLRELRIVERAQGADALVEDMPFSLWYRFARSARIADGPDEVHDVVVARDFLRGALTTLI
ncbi:acyl-CoA dehydrogenase family protein [Sorangium sp. So ce117]|uniref:acyl-CoA dehydrogenase family protein n=1 Tax=Sorangium sp. So ce117 TaxID=3133277 RepID=UPI003F611E49